MDIDPRYEKLYLILIEAFLHAAKGKGETRHGTLESFLDQHMIRGGKIFGADSLLFQAHKKLEEASRLSGEARRAELLGAINYTAGAIITDDLNGGKGGLS